MPIPSPELKVNKLLEKINVLLVGDRKNISSFDIARLKGEAKQLLKSTAGPAWAMLGMIAMLERDYEEMHNAFSRAEYLCPNDPILQMNYSSTLLRIGFFTEATKHMWDLAQKSRDDLDVLRDAQKTFLATHNFDKAKAVSKWLDRLQPGIPPDTAFYEKIDRHLALLESKGLTSEDITAQWEIAYRLIERKYANELSIDHKKSIQEDGSLYIEVGIPDTPEAAASLNLEIAGELTANFENLMPDVLLITTNPLQKTEVEI